MRKLELHSNGVKCPYCCLWQL